MRILLVEDDARVADGLRASLEQAAHAVDHVGSGEAALAAAEAEHYDVIVLDIGLPGIDGFQVLKRLREKRNPASVLVLTAYDAVEDRVVRRLAAKRSTVAELSQAYDGVWWCGHFQSAFDGGPRLSPETLAEIAAYGLPLYIDNYHSDEG